MFPDYNYTIPDWALKALYRVFELGVGAPETLQLATRLLALYADDPQPTVTWLRDRQEDFRLIMTQAHWMYETGQLEYFFDDDDDTEVGG
jgi:hypothetical protein